MSLRISKSRQITIPQELLDCFGIVPNDEVEITATATGLLIRKRQVESDPVEQVYGIWRTDGSTDAYMKEIRQR